MRHATLDSLNKGGVLELPLDLESDPPKLPQQIAFLEDAIHRYQAYGGGFANGKTSAGCVKAIILSIMFPQNQGMICRQEGNKLRLSTMQEFFKICPPQIIDPKGTNAQLGTVKFKRQYGGSTILYQGLQDKLVGTNLGWFWVDQAEEVPEDRFADLVGRLRKETALYDEEGKLIGYAPQYGFVTFNPEGSNHWLYRFFHEDSKEKLDNSKLYMASTYDGLAAGFIRQEYIDGILKTYPEAAQKRYLEGTWDSFEGRIYPQFEPGIHRIPRMPLKSEWRLFESIDWAPQNPTAVGWWALTPPCQVCKQPTRILCDDHYEGGGKGVAYHAAIMKARRVQLNLPVTVTYLDSQCWVGDQSKGQIIYSIKDEFVEHGIIPIAAAKDWEVGFSRITQSLLPCPGSVHPVTGETNAPHFFYMEHCRNFESEALGYTWKKKRSVASDEPIDYNDHHMDEWYYFEASHPSPPPALTMAQVMTPLERIAELRKTYNPLMQKQVHKGSWMSV